MQLHRYVVNEVMQTNKYEFQLQILFICVWFKY